MEAGSKVFLLDEDTSATNFMVRDSFMQRVICREKEPITPFLERARDLYEKAGIVLLLGRLLYSMRLCHAQDSGNIFLL